MNELSKKDSSISGDDIPEKKYTQAIADAVFKNKHRDLEYIPTKFISLEIAKHFDVKQYWSSDLPKLDDLPKSMSTIIRNYLGYKQK